MYNKNIKLYISVIVIFIVFLSITIIAFADPLSIGLGQMFMEATGATVGLPGASLSASESWYNSVTNTDPVSLVTDYENDLLNDLPIKYSHDSTTGITTFQIDATSSIFQKFQVSPNYTQKALTTLHATQDHDSGLYTFSSFGGYAFVILDGNYYYGYTLGQTTQGTEITVNGFTVSIDNNWGRKSYYNGVLIDSGSIASSIRNRPIVLCWNKNINNPSYTYGVIYDNQGHMTPIGAVINQPLDQTNILNWQTDVIDAGTGNNYIHITAEDSAIYGLDLPDDYGTLTSLQFTSLLEILGNSVTDAQLSQEISAGWSDQDLPEPTPPIPPVETPLGEVPYDEWIDTWGQHVIDNQESGNDTLQNIDTNINTGVDTLDSIDTNIGTTNGILGQIKDLLQSGINSITGLLNQILSAVQTLVQSIVNATETLIAGILNQIPIAFQTAWSTIKQHVSIWHYVVEWVTSISSVLSWVWTMASGTSYYIVLPVYASLAGSVVLALYKKFGR